MPKRATKTIDTDLTSDSVNNICIFPPNSPYMGSIPINAEGSLTEEIAKNIYQIILKSIFVQYPKLSLH